MNLSDLSIRNPVFAVMLSAAMIVFGYLGYRDMGVSQFPEIDFPVVSIVITREAASPDIMDGDVTDVEVQLAEPPGVFDEAVLAAVRQYKFKRDGTRYQADQEIVFKIDD